MKVHPTNRNSELTLRIRARDLKKLWWPCTLEIRNTITQKIVFLFHSVLFILSFSGKLSIMQIIYISERVFFPSLVIESPQKVPQDYQIDRHRSQPTNIWYHSKSCRLALADETSRGLLRGKRNWNASKTTNWNGFLSPSSVPPFYFVVPALFSGHKTWRKANQEYINWAWLMTLVNSADFMPADWCIHPHTP